MLPTGDYVELPIAANGTFLTNQGAKFNKRGTGGASGVDFWIHETPVYRHTIGTPNTGDTERKANARTDGTD